MKKFYSCLMALMIMTGLSLPLFVTTGFSGNTAYVGTIVWPVNEYVSLRTGLASTFANNTSPSFAGRLGVGLPKLLGLKLDCNVTDSKDLNKYKLYLSRSWYFKLTEEIALGYSITFVTYDNSLATKPVRILDGLDVTLKFPLTIM